MASLYDLVTPALIVDAMQEAVTEPEVTVSPQGFIQVDDQAGTGYRVREDLIDRLTVRKEMIRTGMAQA